MAPGKVEKKRKNKRKIRTEVPVDLSSDSDASSAKAKDRSQDAPAVRTEDEVVVDQTTSADMPRQTKVDTEKTFEEFYLRQATKELANDLDKLRSVADFRESSISTLIEAVRQGTACFSPDERSRIGGAGVRAAK